MKKWIVIAGILTCLGCGPHAPPSVIMTNPQTGESKYISHTSWGFGMAGIAAAIAATDAQDKAVKAAEMMGFTSMREVK